MKSTKDFFYTLVNIQLGLVDSSSPALWHALLRPGYSLKASTCKARSLCRSVAGFPLLSLAGVSSYLLAITFLSSLLYSCATKTSTPEGILSKDEMARVMTEFYLKESKINSLHLNQDSALVLFQYYREKYTKENSLPDSVIERSYQYYLNNPVELSAIYDRIIDSLALKEQRVPVPVKTQ